MKFINRWGLMRNTRSESLCEHSLETAIIAHALAVIRNKRFGGCLDPERAAALAMFHDTPEIITGDMPTPVKYFSPDIRRAYAEVEEKAQQRLLGMLPEDLKSEYAPLVTGNGEADDELMRLVKAADKISALIKCIEERGMGNNEFSKAEKALYEAIKKMKLEEADCFISEFLPSYSLTVDEQE